MLENSIIWVLLFFFDQILGSNLKSPSSAFAEERNAHQEPQACAKRRYRNPTSNNSKVAMLLLEEMFFLFGASPSILNAKNFEFA